MVLWENPNYEPPKISDAEKIVDSAEHTTDKNVVENFNNNPKLAKEEADKIVEWLPGTLNQLSPEQQKQFVGLVEEYMKWTNLNFAPKDVENVPDLIPPYRKQQIDIYTNTRKNISMLPVDQQETLKKAEKEAISQMTEDSENVLSEERMRRHGKPI